MDFIVALGNDAFYKSAGENMETLVRSIDDIHEAIDGVPPGLKPEILKILN